MEGLEYLATLGQWKTFESGDALMRQHEPSESLHIIVEGKVRVERADPLLSGPVILAELGPGEVVGEMGVLDSEPRSATVTAVDQTRTFELDTPGLTLVILRYPEVAVALLRVLSQRLRSTDELMEQALQE